MQRDLGLVCLALFFAAMFMTIVVGLSHVTNDYAALASHLYLVGASAAWGYVLIHPNRGGISFMIGFFFLFFVAVPARLQLMVETFPWEATFTDSEIGKTYALFALSQVCFVIGDISAERRRARSSQQHCALAIDGPSDEFFYWKCALGFGALTIALLPLIGPGVLFVTRGELGEMSDQLKSSGIKSQLLSIARSMSLLCMVMLLALSTRAKSNHLRRNAGISAGLFAVFFLCANYPPSMPRFTLLGAAIAISAVYVNYFSFSTKAILGAAAPFGLFYALPAIKGLGYGQGIPEILEHMFSMETSEYLLRVDFDGFMQTAETLRYLEHGSIRWGYNFLGVILFIVPRAVWPGKPLDTGEIVSVEMGYEYNNVASPLPAEAIMAFGIPGVMLVFFLLGVVVVRIELSANGPRQNSARLHSLFLYAITMGFITIILRGALNGVASQFGSGYLAYFFMIGYQKYFQRRGQKSR